MTFQASRLRSGEIFAAAGGVILLVVMFLAPWYAIGGRIGRAAAALGASISVDAWNGLSVLRWLMLVTIVAAIALCYFQGAGRAPALPVSLSVVVTALGAVTVLCLIYRVLVNVPGPDDLIATKAGGYLGLIAAVVLTVGGFRSLHEEDQSDAGGKVSIPTIELGGRH